MSRGQDRQRPRGRRHVDRPITLIKFKRSNQGTCINQRPIVERGRARGRRATSSPTAPLPRSGEIALGKNALIGFMTWEGYNYEDAVLLNERLVRDDVLHFHPYRRI